MSTKDQTSRYMSTTETQKSLIALWTNDEIAAEIAIRRSTQVAIDEDDYYETVYGRAEHRGDDIEHQQQTEERRYGL